MKAMADSKRQDTHGSRKRLYWFAGIWLASVMAIAVFAYIARAMMGL